MNPSSTFFVSSISVSNRLNNTSTQFKCTESKGFQLRRRSYNRRSWLMLADETSSGGGGGVSSSTAAVEPDTKSKRDPDVIDSKDLIEGTPKGSPTDTYDGPPPGKSSLDEIQLAKQRKDLVAFARELRELRLQEEREESRIFGFVPKAELLNGRLAMFFFVVGYLTEYWTGYTLPEQVELLARTLGIIN